MFKRLNQTPLYEKVTNEIIEAIFRGDLKPGDKLQSEHELSKTFGVSRVTIREALLSLKQHGIIQVRQGARGGAFVKKMVMDDVAVQMGKILQMSHMTLEQLSDARSLLESFIITRMIDPSDTAAYIERMEDTIAQAEIHLKQGNAEKRLQSNIQFHSIISEMTQNAFIILMHKIVLNMLYDFFKHVKASTAMASRTIQEHRHITRALKANDLNLASKLCAHHIEEIDNLIFRKSKKQSLLKNN